MRGGIPKCDRFDPFSNPDGSRRAQVSYAIDFLRVKTITADGVLRQ